MKSAPKTAGGKSTVQLVRSITGNSIGKDHYLETEIMQAYLQIVAQADSYICILLF